MQITSSSISSSEASGATAARWRGFAALWLVAVALAAAGFLGLAFLLDPYDTGRSPLPLKPGVSPQGPRTAAASRGRDAAYDAAIFGNSHIQLVEPERLKAATGTAFVSLIAPATGPKETMILLDWFLRHRYAPPRAVVIGIDQNWCTSDPLLPMDKPFPTALYSRRPTEYLGWLLRYDVLEEMTRRLRYLFGSSAARARPDGYWDYEPSYRAQGFETDPRRRARLEQPVDTSGGNALGPFPAATRLAARLAEAPSGLAVILVRPPAYHTALPRHGSAEAAADAACREAFATLARSRARTRLVDWRVERPENRDPANFFDHTHYRAPLARLVEADIAAALAAMPAIVTNP